MTEGTNHDRTASEGRILEAAARLFGMLGYNGVSTREIASSAEVNEVTVYRHFPRKRDLYLAVMEAELGRVSLRGDLLARVAQARDAREVLYCTYDLISTAVAKEPRLLRLALFSSLELKPDSDEMLRRHLGELVEVVSRYLQPWVESNSLRCSSAKSLVLALISIIVFYCPLHQAFSAEPQDAAAAFEAFGEICLGAIPGLGKSEFASPVE